MPDSRPQSHKVHSRSRILAAAMGFFAFAAAAQPATAQNSKLWSDSLQTLQRRINTEPYSEDLWLKKAAVNIQMERWDYAIDDYSTVLRHDPLSPAGLYYRAYAHAHVHHYDLARTDYEAFVSQFPSHAEARLGLAHVLWRMRRTGEAMEQVNKVITLHPDSAVAYATRGNMRKELLDYRSALADWKEAARLNPANTEYALTAVDLMLRLNRRAEARQALDALVKRGVPRGVLRKWYSKCK